ncbi:zeta toxin family protein [Rhodococcus sp. T7]|uniref:zeta toxin family protein n=1 Tax=Rhodococcus sp. T7 TaxID=627444 RepID=UPI001358D934|nr:zeta toxin family protein [Rhodococcus sp. T7]KAF0957347.1 hypothetical protein MLGJGCBP_09178 [Rhodococcus sp. T7]KAF0966733.1 hypothetical protein MLGJGCBP_00107 [Rhodococcus sp. T7]
MRPRRNRITNEYLDRIFTTKVRRRLFDDARPPETARPVLIFVGAQPGAGKTRAMHMAIRDVPRAHPVVISGDDFRQYHPEYRQLLDEDPIQMPIVTAELSGPMVRRSLDYAKQEGYSVALEGTFRDEVMVLETAHEFAAAGYEIHVVAVATQAEVSRLAIEDRYLSAPSERARWTPPTAHDVPYVSSAHVLEALEASDVVDRISIYTRADRVYSNARNTQGDWAEAPRALEILETERAQPLTPAAATEWLRDYERVRVEVQERPGYLEGPAGRTHDQLERDADTVREWAHPTGRSHGEDHSISPEHQLGHWEHEPWHNPMPHIDPHPDIEHGRHL